MAEGEEEAKPTTTEQTFGTWDGVFSSCFVNIFGVIVFLRIGWIVANVGIELTIFIILLTEAVALTTALSAIGICRKTNLVCEAGVYTLLTHVLGPNISVPITLLYCLSQAASCSLCAVGFSESISNILGLQNFWIEKSVAVLTILVLVAIMLLGLTWFIWLQMLLILLLLVSIFDFLIGSFIAYDIKYGISGYSLENLRDNSGRHYAEGENFFTSLVIFFPMCCGILAGFNMSTNLKKPLLDIPRGTLSTVAVCSLIYLIFAIVLASTCQRKALLVDLNIPEKLCVSRIIYLIGLHQWSLSSAVGGLGGPPQILQGMAYQSNFIVLRPIAYVYSSNNNPLGAILLHTLFSLLFICVGQLNSLGHIITVPCLLTYSSINFAYFLLSLYIDCLKITNKGDNKAQSKISESNESLYHIKGNTDNKEDINKEFDMDFKNAEEDIIKDHYNKNNDCDYSSLTVYDDEDKEIAISHSIILSKIKQDTTFSHNYDDSNISCIQITNKDNSYKIGSIDSVINNVENKQGNINIIGKSKLTSSEGCNDHKNGTIINNASVNLFDDICMTKNKPSLDLTIVTKETNNSEANINTGNEYFRFDSSEYSCQNIKNIDRKDSKLYHEGELIAEKLTEVSSDIKKLILQNNSKNDSYHYKHLDYHQSDGIDLQSAYEVNQFAHHSAINSLHCSGKSMDDGNISIESNRDASNRCHIQNIVKTCLEKLTNLSGLKFEDAEEIFRQQESSEKLPLLTNDSRKNIKQAFLSLFCNRWISLIGAFGCLISSFLIDWIYSILSCLLILIYFIGAKFYQSLYIKQVFENDLPLKTRSEYTKLENEIDKAN